MPGGNGTGPMGGGPMTGRGMGRCTGFTGGGFGRGCGMGRGNRSRGSGFGNFPQQIVPTVTKEQQMQFLQQQADAFESDLKDIKSQIEQLKTTK